MTSLVAITFKLWFDQPEEIKKLDTLLKAVDARFPGVPVGMAWDGGRLVDWETAQPTELTDLVRQQAAELGLSVSSVRVLENN